MPGPAYSSIVAEQAGQKSQKAEKVTLAQEHSLSASIPPKERAHPG
jgi:hypothetical protein